ncbi:hypothetical protein T02_10188 [Trichinella nativa]|uniref:Uncharacterized protein n=1 Tax=Trichinella nativa TaxID=6335 RepID=A0A0V1L8W9_9BILA|nr:hypothetical protein T02_10188 [Trichinella nativa]
MPLSNIVRVSRHITYVGIGDFNTKGKCTIDKLLTVAAFKLNQGVTTTKFCGGAAFQSFETDYRFSYIISFLEVDTESR